MTDAPDVPDTAEVLAVLDRLGATAAQVAATLEAQGITGRKCAVGGACPLEVYLARQFPRAAGWIFVSARQARVGTKIQWRPMPDACCEFVAAFDHGRFPGLCASAAP